MVDMVQREAEQARYEDRYFERMEAERPKPVKEFSALLALARQAAAGDASAALDFTTSCTPEEFVKAYEAKVWDDQHPLYSCIHCHDGRDLPEGYVCQVCGADNPRGY